MQRIQSLLQGASAEAAVPPEAAAAGSDAAAGAAGAGPDTGALWAVQMQSRAGPGSHLLPAAAIHGASPLLPSSLPPASSGLGGGAHGGAGGAGLPGLPGIAPPLRKVTGKQIVAQRRREREEAKRKQRHEEQRLLAAGNLPVASLAIS